MLLKHISIINYKNIRSADLSLSPKMNCFIGHNGVGKTNLLDAVYYLSLCRSAFHSSDAQVMTHEEQFFMLEGEYDSPEMEQSMMISCGMKRGQKKHFRRDKKEYKRLSQHIGLIPVVFSSPSDTQLIDGGSEERRRLLDMVIAQYDHGYMDSLAAYLKALQQRNALLKLEEEPDGALMDIWEEEMARHGEVLYHRRQEFVELLTPRFQNIYQHIADGKEQISLKYVSHCQRGPLLDVIRRDRMKDRAVGYSLHGVHRDDLELLIDGYPARQEGSQGQRKTLVISLKLAQYEFLRDAWAGNESASWKITTTPLLLLDDIFDKLDASRVERIVRLVSDERYGQIFITDTNREHLDQILHAGTTDYKLFVVDDGVISEQMHE